MPVYRYECSNDHETRRIRKVSDRDEPIECPDDECDEMARRDTLKELRNRVSNEYENFTPYFNENFATDDHPAGQFVESLAEEKQIKNDLNLREKGSFVE